MIRRKLALTVIFALILSLVGASSQAAPKNKNKEDDLATFTFLHLIPATFGADKVDVYSNGQLIFDNATPGSSKSFSVAPGIQQIAIYADGVLPTSETSSVLSYKGIYIPKNSNVTFVAHLTADNKPQLSLFKNMTTEPGSKRSWLTVRHVAGAPTVDVRADSKLLFRSLSNGDERKISLKFGTYAVDVVLAGTSTVAIPATNLVVKDNMGYVVYAWGSASKSNLQYFVQQIMPRKD